MTQQEINLALCNLIGAALENSQYLPSDPENNRKDLLRRLEWLRQQAETTED